MMPVKQEKGDEASDKIMPNFQAIKLCTMMNLPSFGNIRLTNPVMDGKVNIGFIFCVCCLQRTGP
jgi:hypothetical protein